MIRYATKLFRPVMTDCNNIIKKKYDTVVNCNRGITHNVSVVRTITDDLTNNIQNGWVDIVYYTKDDEQKRMGYISFKPDCGQICSIEVDDVFRNQGVAKQLLIDVIEELNNHGVKNVWLISTNNNFWKNVFNGSFHNHNKYDGYFCASVDKIIKDLQ